MTSTKTDADYETSLKWLRQHELFQTPKKLVPTFGSKSHFDECLEIMNLEDGRVRLECGGPAIYFDGSITGVHDPCLDVEAPTFEEAIVVLASLVAKYYNDDSTDVAVDEDLDDVKEEEDEEDDNVDIEFLVRFQDAAMSLD